MAVLADADGGLRNNTVLRLAVMFPQSASIACLAKSAVRGCWAVLFSRISISHHEGFRAAFCIGCLKKMDQKSNMWLRGRKTNWGSACAVIDFEKNGNFRCDIVDITAGKTTMWGKVIDGCKA